MTMQNIGLEAARQLLELSPGHDVERGGFASDSKTMHAELHPRCDVGQRLVGALASGQAVGDDPDLMTALGLAIGEIEDVTKNAANRRAHRVQDTKRLAFGYGHDQDRRSPTSRGIAFRLSFAGAGTGAIASMRRHCTDADNQHTGSAHAPRIPRIPTKFLAAD